MKTTFALLAIIFCISFSSVSQTLGGYDLDDHLVVATAPDCFDMNPEYVTAYPNDSLWVNLDDFDTIKCFFSTGWYNHTGPDLLLETGFHAVNYKVRCILSGGGMSSNVNVSTSDWTNLGATSWSYIGPTCTESVWTSNQFVVALDFQSDFGLLASDEVVGLQIVVQPTPGNPDFAGAYIISPPCENTSSQTSVVACSSYTSPSGTYTWTSSGSYIDTIPNSEGCDSIMYFGLLITGSLDAYAGLISGNTIKAYPDGCTYQWVKCPSMMPIPGATDQTYTATMVGAYAAIVTMDGCVDTTDCIQVNQIGSRVSGEGTIQIVPNPVKSVLKLSNPDNIKIHSIQLFNISGKPIYRQVLIENEIDVDPLDSGLYYLIVTTKEEVFRLSFRKE